MSTLLDGADVTIDFWDVFTMGYHVQMQFYLRHLSSEQLKLPIYLYHDNLEATLLIGLFNLLECHDKLFVASSLQHFCSPEV